MSSRSHIRRCERSHSESSNVTDCLTYYAPTQVTPESGPSLQPCFTCGAEMTPASLLSHQCPSSVILGGSLEDINSSECSFSHSSLSAQSNSYFPGVTPVLVWKEGKSGPFDCLVCNVTLNSESQYDAHLKGRRHRARATGNNTSDFNMSNASLSGRVECGPTERFCEVCCTTVQVANWAMHVEGRTHNRKLSSGAVSLSLQSGPRDDGLLKNNVGDSPMNVCLPGAQMCAVCGVPVPQENMAAHVAGRAHTWKLLSNGSNTLYTTTNNGDSPQLAASTFRIERLFSTYFNTAPRLTTEKGVNVLSSMAVVEQDSVVFAKDWDLTGLGAQLCLSLLLANRQPGNPLRKVDLPPSRICYTLWLCPQKQYVTATVENLRQVLKGVEIPASTGSTEPFDNREEMSPNTDVPTKRPVLLVTLLRDTFTADNPDLTVFEHDIIVSTAGSWENFVANVPGADRSLCAVVISGTEAFMKNDPLDRFINKMVMRPDRGRIICLSTSPIPSWSAASCFTSYSLLE
ncbi:hypothetical protein AAHC03_09569 [Spirometra sp. Aus1]